MVRARGIRKERRKKSEMGECGGGFEREGEKREEKRSEKDREREIGE